MPKNIKLVVKIDFRFCVRFFTFFVMTLTTSMGPMWSALFSSFSSSLELLLELVECWTGRWTWTDLGGTFTTEKNILCSWKRKSLLPKIEHMIDISWVDVISDRSKSEFLPGGSWYKSEGGFSVVPWRRWGLGLWLGCSIYTSYISHCSRQSEHPYLELVAKSKPFRDWAKSETSSDWSAGDEVASFVSLLVISFLFDNLTHCKALLGLYLKRLTSSNYPVLVHWVLFSWTVSSCFIASLMFYFNKKNHSKIFDLET